MDLKLLTDQVIGLTTDVAEFVRGESEAFDRSNVEAKGKNDLVSYVDRESEKRLVSGLNEILPTASFLTEEETVERVESSLQWILDPLDGTTNFVHGLPAFSISVALRHNDEIVSGVVHEISHGECFSAWKNGGAFMNNTPIHVSPMSRLNESLIATGFPIQYFNKKEGYLKIIGELMSESHGIRRLGSAALDLAYVACGRCEGFFECNLNAWDVAAGALIVKEAGGIVTDFKGGNSYLHGREIVAASTVHPELLEVIQKFWLSSQDN